jgi:ribosomal RNA small subunit methyltransferase A
MASDPPRYFLSIHDVHLALDKLGIVPRKHLGQNFLVSWPTIERILSACDLQPDDIVLEIGPGLGALTFEMAARVQQVIAIEIDASMAGRLETEKARLSVDNVDVVVADALAASYPDTITKIVTSMPYSIAGPLTSKILDHVASHHVPAFILCQQEFGTKLLAKPGTGDYSRLSALATLLSEPAGVVAISRRNFFPVPDVDSSFISLRPMDVDSSIDLDAFRRFARAIFPLKNKTLHAAMGIYLKNIGRSDVMPYFQASGLERDERVRQIEPAELAAIASWLKVAGALPGPAGDEDD